MREGPGGLSEQHDHKRSRNRWNHERYPGIHESPGGEHLEERDHDGDERKHHREEKDAHEGILGLIMVDLEAIAGDGAYQQGDEGRDDGISEGVEHRELQVLHADEGLQVLHEIGPRDQLSAYDIDARIRRTADHVVQRKGREEACDDKKCVGCDFFQFSHVCHLPSSEWQTAPLP